MRGDRLGRGQYDFDKRRDRHSKRHFRRTCGARRRRYDPRRGLRQRLRLGSGRRRGRRRGGRLDHRWSHRRGGLGRQRRRRQRHACRERTLRQHQGGSRRHGGRARHRAELARSARRGLHSILLHVRGRLHVGRSETQRVRLRRRDQYVRLRRLCRRFDRGHRRRGDRARRQICMGRLRHQLPHGRHRAQPHRRRVRARQLAFRSIRRDSDDHPRRRRVHRCLGHLRLYGRRRGHFVSQRGRL